MTAQLENEKFFELRFPEVDPAAYKAWKKEGWQDRILDNLEKLLLFVREHMIDGLEVSKIRVACYTPFGREDLYNRRVWLYMHEIDAYQNRYTKKVNEEELALEWKLSGLKRPAREGWVLDENQQWRMVDSRGKYV